MKSKIVFIIVLVIMTSVVVAGFFLNNATSVKYEENSNDKTDIKFVKSLEPPILPLQDDPIGSSFLDTEAGMSAYTDVGKTIDLNDARNAFRTIEYETSTYIIGSVPLPDYTEIDDVHCYIHVSGWIVCYYHKDEPTSKIIDWVHYNPGSGIIGNKLDVGINVVCDAAYVVPGTIQYFNFEWPNGQKMMIIAEDVESTSSYDSFIITLPSTFAFYERSYSLHNVFQEGYGGTSNLYIDDVIVGSLTKTGQVCGLLTGSQLSTGVAHTVKVYRPMYTSETMGSLVLIYREP